MGNVTKNLSLKEWSCRCGCGLDNLHPTVVQRLQDIRTATGKRLTITSGCRCQDHNLAEGGAPASYHLPKHNGYTWAADFTLEGVYLAGMLKAAWDVPEFGNGGVGIYLDYGGPRIHIDVRDSGPYHWGRLDGREATIAKVLMAAYQRGQ